MLLPESMSKILVVGTKDQLPATIDLLYSLENVHVIDFPSDGEEGFTLGSPLSAASDASLKLLKLRSMEKDLEIDGRAYKEKISVKQEWYRVRYQVFRLLCQKPTQKMRDFFMLSSRIYVGRINCISLSGRKKS